VSSDIPRENISNAQWDSSSIGKKWQFSFFAVLIRFGGRRIAYFFMYFVVAWYILLRPLVRRRCRYYLNRRFPNAKNPFTRLWHDYRRIEAFGETLIDRAVFGFSGNRAFHLEFPEGPRLQELINEGRGLIILNSHVGCWQVAMSALSYLQSQVNIVIHQGAADIDPRWFTREDRAVPFSIIDPVEQMGGIMQMISTLKNNQVLGIMADRVFGDDPNTLEADFLGGPVNFPVSPYRLASMQETPIVVLFSYKTGFSTYRIELSRIIRVPEGLGRNNSAYKPYLCQFVEALEGFVSNHPWQFFNFHDMWTKKV